jgi:type 1 glutamine amidotransferase
MSETDPGCRSLVTSWMAIAILCCVALFMLAPERARASADAEERFALLVFSRTVGFRHDSIPAGIAAIRALGSQHGFEVDATEAPGTFSDEGLARYRVVVFLNTTGAVLDAGQHAAFERFIARGGGFVGIHSAADTEYDWPWYGKLVGAYFRSHPVIQSATLNVVDPAHVSTRDLPAQWTRIDEWYNFRNVPGPDVSVLIRIDEPSYKGGTMGGDHPMAWCHAYGGGRAWYTAVGHTIESYSDRLFLQHLRGGIAWAAGVRVP